MCESLCCHKPKRKTATGRFSKSKQWDILHKGGAKSNGKTPQEHMNPSIEAQNHLRSHDFLDGSLLASFLSLLHSSAQSLPKPVKNKSLLSHIPSTFNQVKHEFRV